MNSANDPMALQYANTFMTDLEIHFLYSCLLIHFEYVRYIKTFIMWTQEESSREVPSALKFHLSIKLTLECLTQQIKFLDTPMSPPCCIRSCKAYALQQGN